MEKARLGKTELLISRVTYGGIISMDEGQEDADRFVAHAVERGVNYFDIAPSYGNAEQMLSPSLKPYRDKVYLACKTEKRDGAQAKAALLNSLKVLQTPYFDVYQLHGMATQEELQQVFAPGGAMETLIWAKKEGLIRHIGITAHSEDIVLKCLDLFPFESVMFPMNWALGLNTGWGDRIAERCKAEDIGLLAIKTIIHRNWREGEEKTYPKSWCKPITGNEALAIAGMKYGLYKGAVSLVPPGNFEHFNFMLNNIDSCLKNPLSAKELEMLRQEAALVKEEMIF